MALKPAWFVVDFSSPPPEDQDPVIGRCRGNAGGDQRDGSECECAGEQEESAGGLTHGVLQGVVPVARHPGGSSATRNMLEVSVEGFNRVS